MDPQSEERSFEAKLTVLESRKSVRWFAIAAVILGPIALVLALVHVLPPGFLGLHLALAGAEDPGSLDPTTAFRIP